MVQADNDLDPTYANAGTTIVAETSLSIHKTASDGSPEPGDVFSYYIVVSNGGPSTAKAVVVTDTLPAEVTYINDTLSPDCVALGGNVYRCGWATSTRAECKLRHHGHARRERGKRPDPDQPGGGERRGDAGGKRHGPDHRGRRRRPAQSAKFVKPDDKVQAGTPFVYTIFVDNLGPSPAYTVTLVDTMFASGSFEVVTATVGSGGACNLTAPTVGNPVMIQCTLPVLAPMQRATIHVTAVASDTMDVNNEVSVIAAKPVDRNTANNFASAAIRVAGTADLAIVKSAEPTETVVAGNQIVYTLVVSNSGPSMATNAVVQDLLPLGLHIVDGGVTASQGSCGTTQTAEGNTLVTCNLGNLPMNGAATVMITALVDAGVPHGTVLINQATVGGAEYDPDTGDNISAVSTPVIASITLEIKKYSEPAQRHGRHRLHLPPRGRQQGSVGGAWCDGA